MFDTSKTTRKPLSQAGTMAVITGKDNKSKSHWETRFDKLEKLVSDWVDNI